ncbi:MAG: integrase [Planctomycetaceae bacterium]|nr:integrase [Planctomycetaceae bacterium]
MASITKQPNGRRMIQFIGPDKKRRSIRLGKVPQRTAESMKLRVEALVASSITGHAIDDETSRWVRGLDDGLSERLAAVGLIQPKASSSIGDFVDSYIASRTDLKPATITVLGPTRRNMIDFFGHDRPLRDITEGDADEFRLHLVREGLSDNTARRRCGFAKQFLRAAQRRGLVDRNPFADLSAAVRSNTARLRFVSAEDAEKVIDACPDTEWRLIFALCRFGGLRCPSEVMAMRWTDVNWGASRITVRSSKTEHHEDGESRLVPIFPELLPHLRQQFEEAEPGVEWVITRNRGANRRKRLVRIIRRAGLEPWPKLFQNLRSTRETELAESYPMHVVCAWIGNSQVIAAKHYLQVTEDHFAQAAQGGALHNAMQHPAAQGCTEHQNTSRDEGKPAFRGSVQRSATSCKDRESREKVPL